MLQQFVYTGFGQFRTPHTACAGLHTATLKLVADSINFRFFIGDLGKLLLSRAFVDIMSPVPNNQIKRPEITCFFIKSSLF